MVHPGDSLWRRSELWGWLAKATAFTLIPVMTLGITAVLSSSQPRHQTANRAAKSDAMVSLAMLKAKREAAFAACLYRHKFVWLSFSLSVLAYC